MGIIYKVKAFSAKRKNPKDGTAAYYAQKWRYSTIQHKELVSAVARNTGIPEAKCYLAVAAIVKSIQNFVFNGHSVKIPELGVFSATINARGVESAEKFNAGRQVKRINLRFRVDPAVRREAQAGISFEITDQPVAASNTSDSSNTPNP